MNKKINKKNQSNINHSEEGRFAGLIEEGDTKKCPHPISNNFFDTIYRIKKRCDNIICTIERSEVSL